MSATCDRSRGAIFDGLAELYDAVRPGYPESLVDEILARAPERACVLEIGCGSGQATRAFARRGLRVTCLEPSPNLARRARANLAPWPDVVVEERRFEAWPLREGGFDLVIAAQAFHWLDPRIAYTKAGRALRPGGALALFWNRPVWDAGPLREAIDEAYRLHAPQIAPAHSVEIEGVLEGIRSSGLFGPVSQSRHAWIDRRSARDYLRLLGTYSDHAALPAAQREALLRAIGAAIERFGGAIVLPQVALLYLAERGAGAPEGGRAQPRMDSPASSAK